MASAGSSPVIDELRAAMRKGDWVDVGSWTGGQDVPAAVLREVLLTPAGDECPCGLLWLANAHVTGRLNLSRCILGASLRFDGCRFDQPLTLVQTSVQSLRINGGELPGLEAPQLRSDGDLELVDGLRINGVLNLGKATVKGNLHLSATVEYPSDRAVVANMLHVDGDVDFDGAWACRGSLSLAGAEIAGHLHLAGGRITKGTLAKYALDGEGLTVAHNVDIEKGTVIEGPVYLPFAHFGAQLHFSHVTISAEGRAAIDGQGVQAGGDVLVTRKSKVHGRVDFVGAVIHGDLSCDGSTFEARKASDDTRVAIKADRAEIGGAVFFQGSEITGEVRLLGTHVGSDLDCSGATLHNDAGAAIYARRARFDKDVLLCDCDASGAKDAVDLVRVEIGGALRCDDGKFTAAPTGRAIDLRGARIGGVLNLLPREAPIGVVDLQDAQCAVLRDDPATWPAQIGLDGFRYGSFPRESPSDVKQRLQWLLRNLGGYSSRVYEQLISVLRASGNEEDARTVALAREQERVRQRTGVFSAPLRVLLTVLFGWTVGYGYKTRRIVWWFLGLLVAGSLLFGLLHHLRPSEFVLSDPGKPHPAFNPVVFAADLLVPVIGLGQRGVWVPNGVAELFTLIYTVLGWVLAAALAAGLTQLVRRS